MNRTKVLRRAQLPGDMLARASARVDPATNFRLRETIEAGTAGGPARMAALRVLPADEVIALWNASAVGGIA